MECNNTNTCNTTTVTEQITVTKLTDVYLKIKAEPHIIKEASQYFTFAVPNAQFSPQFRKKHWDGKIKLLDMRSGKLYVGLLSHLKKFADNFGYSVVLNDDIFPKNNITPENVVGFCDHIKPHSKNNPIKHHDYQYKGTYLALNRRRTLLVSPTASGKSLIIYSIIRAIMGMGELSDRKLLIIVPTTSLVEQMYSDFSDYSSHNGWNTEKHCHRIYSGMDKTSDKRIFISTWQSIYDFPKEYFDQFGSVIVDEVHLAEASSIKGIMEKLESCPYRIGLTGTLKDAKTHRLTLEGLFGRSYQIETTKNLMDRGHITPLHIDIAVLKYNKKILDDFVRFMKVEQDEAKKTRKKFSPYQSEMRFICQLGIRNLFIRNLALELEGNTLVLFQFVDKHGVILRDLIETECPPDRKVFFVVGKTDTDAREEVRRIVAKENNAIILASYGVFSTGINIPNLHNGIFASPYKSKVKVLQSIGRGLRKHESKDVFNLYDISDDLKIKDVDNYGLKHCFERIAIYDREQFEYDITTCEVE